MKNLKIELKSLKELNDEERKNFAKSEWQDEKMQEWLIKNYDFYKTTDGYIFEVEKASKLSIVKKLYYDDEYEAPQVNYENFEDANKYKCNKFNYFSEKADKQYIKFYFAINGNLKNVYVEDLDEWELNERPHNEILRELTADEKYDVVALYKKQKDEYAERLKKYWNKYKNHITTCGYWANR